MATPSVLDQVRKIPLESILAYHGLSPKPEGSTVRYKNDRFNIVVSGDGRGVDNAASVGGQGANDLLLHKKYGEATR